jgi:hypothetical protein
MALPSPVSGEVRAGGLGYLLLPAILAGRVTTVNAARPARAFLF